MAPAFSDAPLSFHTDHFEVFSFYYQEMSPTGRQTTLSSSWQIYNQLAATLPRFRYSRYPILGWPRKQNSELPAPSQEQMRALDAVQLIAQKNAMPLTISRDDMIFINDMAVFHARSEFKEGDPSMKRHLLKTYLRDPEQGWVVPQSLQETFGVRYTHKPGDLSPEVWDIDHKRGLEELPFVNG